MTLLLYHTRVAQIDCSDCLKRRYDLKTGKPDFYIGGPNREKMFFWGQPVPCQTDPENGCPKGQPHQGKLSDRNRKLLLFYLRGRAVSFAGVPLDRLARDNLSIVDSIFRSWERYNAGRQAHEAIEQLVPLLRHR